MEKNTYVIKYKNERGHMLKKYIMAKSQTDAYAVFKNRFGMSNYVYGCDILI